MADPPDIQALKDCPQCGYDLTGRPDGHTCPECGFEYAAGACCFKLGRRADRAMSVTYFLAAALYVPLLLLALRGQTPWYEVVFQLFAFAAFAAMATFAYRRLRYGRPGQAFSLHVVFDARGFRLFMGPRVTRSVTWNRDMAISMTPHGQSERIRIIPRNRTWRIPAVLDCEVELTPRQAETLRRRLEAWIEDAPDA